MLKEIKSVEQYKALFGEKVNDDKLYFLDVWASWCGPCKMLMPIVEKISSEYADSNIEFYKMNCDDQELLGIAKKELGVTGIPALFFIRNGEVVKKTGNPKTSDKLKALIDEVLDA